MEKCTKPVFLLTQVSSDRSLLCLGGGAAAPGLPLPSVASFCVDCVEDGSSCFPFLSPMESVLADRVGALHEARQVTPLFSVSLREALGTRMESGGW